MWDSKPKLRVATGGIHCTPVRQILHLKRVPCRVKLLGPDGNERVLEGRIVLNDMTLTGAAIYLPEMIVAGTVVKFELDYPVVLQVAATVGWEQKLYIPGKVITGTTHPFRIGLLFQAGDPEVDAKLQRAWAEITSQYPGVDMTRAPYAQAS